MSSTRQADLDSGARLIAEAVLACPGAPEDRAGIVLGILLRLLEAQGFRTKEALKEQLLLGLDMAVLLHEGGL